MENQADMQAAQPQQPEQNEPTTNQVANDTNAIAEDEIETYWKPVRENSGDFDYVFVKKT